MTDHILDLMPPTRGDRILQKSRHAAFTALHKAGFAPKKKPDPAAAGAPGADAACPHCGGAMADHAPPTKPQATPPKPPSNGSDLAQAGATAQGEPPIVGDESDAIEDLADDMDGDGDVDEDDAAAAGGDVDPIEDLAGEGEEGDEEELPEDDGQNHGVGDLDGDGSAGSLIAEVTSLETAYYAAKGLHGDGPKAMVVLDRYHRAVRALVRSLQGQGQAETPVPGEEETPVPPQGAAKPPAGAPPGAAKPKPPGAAGAAPAKPPGVPGGKPPTAAAKPGDKPVPPGKPAAPGAAKPDGEEEDPRFKKSLSAFVTYSDDAPVPDDYLIDYFGAFVEEAFEAERQENAHQWITMTPIDWATCVLREFVMRLPKNANFRKLAEKYRVDAPLIAAMLITAKLVKPGGDVVGLEGGNGYGNAPVDIDGGMVGYAKSMPWLKPDHRSSPGIKLPEREVVQLAEDTSESPFALLRKGLLDQAARAAAQLTSHVEAPMQITETTSQRLEREANLARARMAANHLLKLG